MTQLLRSWQHGDADALERLLPVVYEHLHRLAHARLRGEPLAQTLQTTALVHEAYLRLVDGTDVPWKNRAHFFALCARLMRRILIDRARARRSEKRGGAVRHVHFQDWLGAQPANDAEILAVDEALTRLSTTDPRRSKVVELRYFGGLTVEEAAAVLDISPETVRRDFNVAKRWLRHELRSTRPEAGG